MFERFWAKRPKVYYCLSTDYTDVVNNLRNLWIKNRTVLLIAAALLTMKKLDRGVEDLIAPVNQSFNRRRHFDRRLYSDSLQLPTISVTNVMPAETHR